MNRVSIIMCAYDNSQLQRQITTAALGNIQKYTDVDDYELILVDNGSEKEINQKYNCIKIDKHIEIDDIGYSASMNLGAKESDPKYPYICFIHNDVFVWEDWLNKLFPHLNNFDVVVPSQGHITRQEVLDSYQRIREQLDNDAGMMLMSKETFKKTEGWDERLWSIYHDYGFRNRIKNKGLTLKATADVIITHIGWTSLCDDKRFDEFRQREGPYVDIKI